MEKPWGFLDYLTREFEYLFANSKKTWKNGTHEQKRQMVRDALERARILHSLSEEK